MKYQIVLAQLLLAAGISAQAAMRSRIVTSDRYSNARHTATKEEVTSEPVADFSGISGFWGILDALKADREPTTEQWDKLFATPGYAALEQREYKRKILSEAFRLAYMPLKRGDFDAALKKSGWLAFILPHLRKIPALREQLMAFQHRLQSPGWLARAAGRAQKFLPARVTKQSPLPPVSFIFFAPDARGYRNIIVADLLHIMLYPDIEKFFGHELFHFYRHRVARTYRNVSDTDAPLMDLLTYAEEEGVADQVDKAEIPLVSDEKLEKLFPDADLRSFYADYRRYYATSNDFLRQVEEAFEAIADQPTTSKERSSTLRQQLPFDGRTIGDFMARTIIREARRKNLIKVVGDPLAFWQLYNDAARRSKGKAYPFSAKAMSTVQNLAVIYRDK